MFSVANGLVVNTIKSCTQLQVRGIKTRKGVAKRFKVTKKGFKFKHAGLVHNLSNHPRHKKLALQRKGLIAPGHKDHKKIKRCLGI